MKAISSFLHDRTRFLVSEEATEIVRLSEMLDLRHPLTTSFVERDPLDWELPLFIPEILAAGSFAQIAEPIISHISVLMVYESGRPRPGHDEPSQTVSSNSPHRKRDLDILSVKKVCTIPNLVTICGSLLPVKLSGFWVVGDVIKDVLYRYIGIFGLHFYSPETLAHSVCVGVPNGK